MGDSEKKVDEMIEETMKEISDGFGDDFQDIDIDEGAWQEDEVWIDEEDVWEGPGGEEKDGGEEGCDTEEAETEDEEDEEEEGPGGPEEDGAERAGRRPGMKKRAAIAAAGVFGVLAAVYLGFAFYFNSHFMFYTSINGVDVSMKAVSEVEDYMRQQVADYVLTLEMGENSSLPDEEITGADISMEYAPSDELTELVEGQENLLWLKTLWEKPEITARIGVQYNEESLAARIAALNCMVPENQTASADAHPEFQDTQFEVVKEVTGTQINEEAFNSAVRTALDGFLPTLDLLESGSYIQPRFTEESPEVTAARDAMNAYLGAEVTYDFNPYTELVDASVIATWVKTDADMNVTFDEEAVRAYIASLAAKYDTLGSSRQFTTATGNVVTVDGGTYGWQIDQEAEYAALTANIQNAEVVTREAAYASRAASHDVMDMGGTYLEVDIQGQHMYFIQDGQIVMDSAVVTGNPNNGNSTPTGTYTILEKMRNKVLRGDIINEATGEREYETPVSYWMRVTWTGIGFHDATWQAAFGGERYRNGYGSHGCINMPYDQAANLYSMIEVGIPVVIHN